MSTAQEPQSSLVSQSNSPPTTDLKPKTSNAAIPIDAHRVPSATSKRAPHHLKTSEILLGAHSPTSIPSSPASIRSTSSAIFERDIEPISPPMLSPPNLQNPHRIPRARSTEQLEHAVPSVLDSAASVLASIKDDAEVDVVAPANIDVLSPWASGFASPIGSLRSRSPSPSVGETLIQSVSPHVVSSFGIPLAQPKAADAAPSIVAPSNTSSTTSVPAPTNTLAPTSPSTSPTTTAAAAAPTAHSSSHSPPNKRLSFMSYSDLLSSTPASLHPLSSLTTSASSQEPPPHIPSVTGISLAAGSSRTPSIRGRKRDSILLDDVGGEWEREGMGMGLEERLEGVANVPLALPQPPKA